MLMPKKKKNDNQQRDYQKKKKTKGNVVAQGRVKIEKNVN